MHISDDFPLQQQVNWSRWTVCRQDHVLTHIHSIYLHHDSLLHLALKKQAQGVEGAVWQVSCTLPVTLQHFLEE